MSTVQFRVSQSEYSSVPSQTILALHQVSEHSSVSTKQGEGAEACCPISFTQHWDLQQLLVTVSKVIYCFGLLCSYIMGCNVIKKMRQNFDNPIFSLLSILGQKLLGGGGGGGGN